MKALPFLLALLACHPVAPPHARVPCGLETSDVMHADATLWAAIEAHDGMVGTCRIGRGAREGSYEIRDDKRLVAVLDACSIDVRIPGLTSGGIGVGMRPPQHLECHTYDRGTECWPHEDDDLDPVVRYVVRDDTVQAVQAATRCD